MLARICAAVVIAGVALSQVVLACNMTASDMCISDARKTFGDHVASMRFVDLCSMRANWISTMEQCVSTQTNGCTQEQQTTAQTAVTGAKAAFDVYQFVCDQATAKKCGIAKLFDCLDDVFEKVLGIKENEDNETETENDMTFSPKMFEDLRKLSMSMVKNNSKYCSVMKDMDMSEVMECVRPVHDMMHYNCSMYFSPAGGASPLELPGQMIGVGDPDFFKNMTALACPPHNGCKDLDKRFEDQRKCKEEEHGGADKSGEDVDKASSEDRDLSGPCMGIKNIAKCLEDASHECPFLAHDVETFERHHDKFNNAIKTCNVTLDLVRQPPDHNKPVGAGNMLVAMSSVLAVTVVLLLSY